MNVQLLELFSHVDGPRAIADAFVKNLPDVFFFFLLDVFIHVFADFNLPSNFL